MCSCRERPGQQQPPLTSPCLCDFYSSDRRTEPDLFLRVQAGINTLRHVDRFSGGDIVETQAEGGDASTGQEVRADPLFGLEMGEGFPDLPCHWLIFYSVDMFSYC